MKTTKTPDADSKKFTQQLNSHFSADEIASFVLTLLGMSDIAHMFIWEKARDFIELPIQVKYSLVQHASFYRLFGLVARDEFKKEECAINFMPVDEEGWKSDEDFEQRFIHIVKAFYKGLEEEGKV